jgi:hypothetical protein
VVEVVEVVEVAEVAKVAEAAEAEEEGADPLSYRWQPQECQRETSNQWGSFPLSSTEIEQNRKDSSTY